MDSESVSSGAFNHMWLYYLAVKFGKGPHNPGLRPLILSLLATTFPPTMHHSGKAIYLLKEGGEPGSELGSRYWECSIAWESLWVHSVESQDLGPCPLLLQVT